MIWPGRSLGTALLVPTLLSLALLVSEAIRPAVIALDVMVGAVALADLATLIGATSDNLATNVLLRRIGLEGVRAATAELGLRSTALHDEVRDVRGPDVPERLSSGTAAELATYLVEKGKTLLIPGK
jgi:beta-lactamase class A